MVKCIKYPSKMLELVCSATHFASHQDHPEPNSSVRIKRIPAAPKQEYDFTYASFLPMSYQLQAAAKKCLLLRNATNKCDCTSTCRDWEADAICFSFKPMIKHIPPRSNIHCLLSDSPKPCQYLSFSLPPPSPESCKSCFDVHRLILVLKVFFLE